MPTISLNVNGDLRDVGRPPALVAAPSVTCGAHPLDGNFQDQVVVSESALKLDEESVPQDYTEGEFVIHGIKPRIDWDEFCEKRFVSLVKKRALSSATVEENEEFLLLQDARRSHADKLTADQIFAEVKREEMARDLVRFFRKYSIR